MTDSERLKLYKKQIYWEQYYLKGARREIKRSAKAYMRQLGAKYYREWKKVYKCRS